MHCEGERRAAFFGFHWQGSPIAERFPRVLACLPVLSKPRCPTQSRGTFSPHLIHQDKLRNEIKAIQLRISAQICPQTESRALIINHPQKKNCTKLHHIATAHRWVQTQATLRGHTSPLILNNALMAPTSVSATHLSNPHVKMLIGPQPATVRGAATHLGKHPKLPKVIYPSGKQVVVRDLENLTDFFVYRGHNAAVTVAKVRERDSFATCSHHFPSLSHLLGLPPYPHSHSSLPTAIGSLPVMPQARFASGHGTTPNISSN